METSDSVWSVHPTYALIQNVLDTLNAGILVRTVDGKILFANDRLLHWVDYTAKELDGQDFRMLVPNELEEQLDEEIREIHSGDERLRIAILKRKDGRTLPIVFCPKILRRDDDILAVVTVVLDLGEVQTARRIDDRPASGLVRTADAQPLRRRGGDRRSAGRPSGYRASVTPGARDPGRTRWGHTRSGHRIEALHQSAHRPQSPEIDLPKARSPQPGRADRTHPIAHALAFASLLPIERVIDPFQPSQ